MKKIFLKIVLILLSTYGYGQFLSNFRSRTLPVETDTLRIDSLSLIQNSLFLFDTNGLLIPDSLYSVDYIHSLLIPDDRLRAEYPVVKITYRVFPYSFSASRFHKDTAMITSEIREYNPFGISGEEGSYGNFFEKDKIEKRGSISRGVSFGNNQDAVMNSNLNLQLSGNLSDDIQIQAAISDNNIPIQPDGASQQLQEFDKVYIRLFNRNTNLTVGDFELNSPPGYFLKMNKKVQGARFSTSVNLPGEKDRTFRTLVSGAVVKGKYNRMKFDGIEGNQGPYKLTGAENETFIIILAGTERVYIDGRLMKRGQEYDYVIDYNTAEIVFTAGQPITKDKRITVEFEYSERSYARFLVFNNNEFISGKSKFSINLFSESDSKNQPFQQELTDPQKQFLSTLGDSLHLAVIPHVDSVAFDNKTVLYQKKDTVVNSITYQDIYVYSTNPDSAWFRLGFSYAGQNNGNYRQVKSSANGKVFQWIAPISGIPQGDHEPVVLLITPKKKQMITFGAETNITNSTETQFEIALTENDVNTFSSLHKSDNTGYALRAGIKQHLLMKDTSQTRMYASAVYQLINSHFDPVERYRNVEFERDWNLSSSADKKNEHLANASLDFFYKNLGTARLESHYMNRENRYSAVKNNINTRMKKKGFVLDFTGSLLNSSDDLNNTRFLRHNTSLSKELPFLIIGIKEDRENNLWKKNLTDSLLGNSYSFFQWEGFITSPDSAKTRMEASYKNRQDFLPSQNRLTYATLGEDMGIGISFLKNTNHTLKTSVNYRKLTIRDTLLSHNKPENSVTGRLDHQIRMFRGTVVTSTFYELGSGLDIKKEYSYIEVSTGQGIYSWTDYNGNGIRELDEFEVANFQDQANFIRVFTPTNEYIRTYFNQFNQQISLNLYKIWAKEKGWKKFASRFSDQFAFRINQKTTDTDFLHYANPLTFSISDSTLITTGISLRNTFSFNKSHPVFGMDWFVQENKNRVLLVNGIDQISDRLNGLRVRWNIIREIILTNDFDIGEKIFSSDYFSSKNHETEYYKNETSVSYQPGMKLRVTLSYLYTDKANRLGPEKSQSHNTGTELRYNILDKGNLTVTANYISLNYNSETNTPVAYTMLEGFQPGSNVTWGVIFQRSLSTSLQMNLNYNGRVSKGSKVIHTGGVQLRAVF